uniref:Zan_0 protein n=1 Tax=Fopius arisanus TaxID=64838 RepID=A0A0C9R997_9HYME
MKMRLKMISPVVWALLLSQVASRPQQTVPATRTSQVTKHPDEDARSRLEPQKNSDLKDYMDQSLRTVATQLLNVSGPEGPAEPKNDTIKPKQGLLIRKPDRTIPPAQESPIIEEMERIKGVTPDMTAAGRPVNSKYNYFEVSHPGQAMAMTDEDLEREVAATRYPSYKNQQTTTGGLSTWILLNPPSSTNSPDDVDKTVPPKSSSSTHPEEAVTTPRATVKTTSPPQKTTQKTTKLVSSKKTTPSPEKSSSSPGVVTPRSEPAAKMDEETTAKATTKKTTPTKTTSKPKTTTGRPTTVLTKTTTMKIVKSQPRPSKPAIRKTTTTRAEVKTNFTSKIEKVTFKPVLMITTPKSLVESISKPIFNAKVQGSIKTDHKPLPIESTPKPTNVLKLHLKKPVDTPTTIQIDPIKVSAPVLTIEKLSIPEDPEDKRTSLEPVPLTNSQIDVKFDFNPESTRVETSTETTTKRSKAASKRKKHKTRRRKPATTSSPSSTAATPAEDSPLKEPIKTSTPASGETSLQESKIVPDANTKQKKKQVAKPITTQIYNFISREVMPSVGVMSLVGLGLGLASYFLYPFGGAISRRNYEVEPNYKYNLDEYGGNYGQREEEVFTKVLQGMNSNDGKYGGIKDFNKNYYRYQAYDGGYTDTTRRTDPRFPASSVPVFRPEKTSTVYDMKYRNTGFKYSDGSTTPSYYDRSKGSDFVETNVDRQFVVGNIPKEYSSEEKAKFPIDASTQPSGVDFEKQIAQSLHFRQTQADDQVFDQPNAQALKSESYEDVEITPAAVAVEHGPRSLNSESGDSHRDVHGIKKRMRRDSVIQFIPSRSEIEREEREMEDEEPLSNEILDIIDSALPGEMADVKKETKKTEIVPESEKSTTSPTPQAAEETESEKSSTKSPETTSPGTEATNAEVSENSSGGDETFTTTPETPAEGFNVLNFVKRLAEVKFRLGLTILKHASESFARYLGHVQKRINGDE